MPAIYVDREPARQRTTPRESSTRGGKWSNQHKRERNDYPGQGSAPLSTEQKATICITAARAFQWAHKREPISTAERDLWRRAEQIKAVGRPSLTVCTQAHYLPLLAHFEELSGELGDARAARDRDATAPQRAALHKLGEICAQRGVDLSYAAVIMRSKYKCALDEATAKQVWSVYFDLKNRKGKDGRKKAQKAQKPAVDIPF